MKKQKILITGAAGFIGHALSKKLVQEDYEVIGLDNINSYYDVNLKYARLADLGINRQQCQDFNQLVVSKTFPEFKFIKLNLEDREALPELFKSQKFDQVVNLAAQAGVRYSLENPESYIDSNIVGFLNLLECCRHNQIKHLVYASSSSVYGANKKVPFEEDDRVDYPVSLYAATKKSNELMAYTYSHLYSMPTSGLRFFTVYGPWGRPDMAPILFASAISKNQPIKVFNQGNMSRDFTYIDDIVNGMLLTLKNSPTKENNKPYYQLFNIGNGSPVNLMEFIQTLESELGIIAEKKMMGMQPGDVPQTWAETSKLGKLGYNSKISINEGVKKFVEWFVAYNK